MSADSLRSMALLETGFVEILKQFFTAKFDKVETFSCTAQLKNDDEFDRGTKERLPSPKRKPLTRLFCCVVLQVPWI